MYEIGSLFCMAESATLKEPNINTNAFISLT